MRLVIKRVYSVSPIVSPEHQPSHWPRRASFRRRFFAADGLINLVPVRRNVLERASGGQRGFLQPGVHLFDVLEARLKIADPLTKAAYFLRDRLEVFHAWGH
jgi:hypothetical protein